MIKWFKRGAFNVLIAIDQLGNAISGGDPDETISSRAGKLQDRKTWARWLCKLLNWAQTDHCTRSIEPDRGSNAL